MMDVLLIGMFLGAGIGAAAAHSFRSLWVRHVDEKLREDRDYWREEAKRLREQVALHIGEERAKELNPLVAYQADQRSAAAARASL